MGNRSSKGKKIKHNRKDIQTLIETYMTVNEGCWNPIWIFNESHCEAIKAAVVDLKSPEDIASLICSYLDNRLDTRQYCQYIRLCHSVVNDGEQLPEQWVKSMITESKKKSEIHSGSKGLMIGMFGYGASGKTALARSFVSGTWEDPGYDPTIEEFYSKQWEIDGIGNALINVLDTAGPDQYVTMQDQWMWECDIIILCFRLDMKSSLDRCVDDLHRIKRLFEVTSKNPRKKVGVMLTACQMDLIYGKQSNELSSSMVEQIERNRKRVKGLCVKCNIPMIETSAKEYINIEFLFTQSIHEYWLQTTSSSINWKGVM